MAGIGNLGIALGGAADAFNQTRQAQSLDNYRQQELKLQQQAESNRQQREFYTRIDSQRSELVNVIGEHIKQAKIANPNISAEELSRFIQPLKDPLMRLDRSSGRDPAATDAMIVGMIARPSETVTAEAMARAKVDPLKAATPTVMGEDSFGSPVYGTYDRRSGQFQPTQPMQPTASTGRQASGTSGEQTSPADRGEAFLARLPEQLRAQVKGLADYELSPNTFSARIAKGTTQSQRQRMVGLAEEYAAARGDTYDQKEFTGRNAAVNQFSKGAEARSVRSFNVLVSHLDTLGEASNALKNGDTRLLNAIANRWATETGEPAPTTFEGVRAIVGDELVKAIVGGGGALGDREEIKKTISSASSPKQLADLIEKYKDLAGGQLGGLRKQYESTTGRKDFDRFLDEGTKAVFKRKADRGNLTSAEPQGGQIGPVQWRLVQ